jgi:DNA-directed RNA polymerase subunit RPC12/RpoP
MGRPTPVSYLPSMLLPCPACGSRFELKTVEPDPIAHELDHITHACVRCGTELTRTVWARPSDVLGFPSLTRT